MQLLIRNTFDTVGGIVEQTAGQARPAGAGRSVASSVGFLALGMLVDGLVWLLVWLVVALIWLPPFGALALKVGNGTFALATLLVLVFVNGVGPVLAMTFSRNWPRVAWGAWWVLAVDAALRLASGFVVLFTRSGTWMWAPRFYIFYFLAPDRWLSLALATIIGAVCAMVVLWLYRSVASRDAFS